MHVDVICLCDIILKNGCFDVKLFFSLTVMSSEQERGQAASPVGAHNLSKYFMYIANEV